MQVRKASRSEWESFVRDCPAATFFHSYHWYALWAEYLGQSFEARIFTVNGEDQALLPLLVGPALKGLAKAYVSSPAGTYGGYLCKAKLSASIQRELLDYLKTFSMLSLCGNPFDPTWSEPLEFTANDFTQAIDLSQGWDNIFSQWSKGNALGLRKTKREGVEIKMAQAADWPIYFDLYQETMQNWKVAPLGKYSWSFFEQLQQLPEKHCQLYLAWHQGKIIAGCLCFYQNQHVVYWHGASALQSKALRPVPLLQYQIIQDAIARGFRWYDFNPSAQLEGVIRFKKGFGAKKLRFESLEKQAPAIRVLSKLFRSLRKQ